jgi:hypothetical protein
LFIKFTDQTNPPSFVEDFLYRPSKIGLSDADVGNPAGRGNSTIVPIKCLTCAEILLESGTMQDVTDHIT